MDAWEMLVILASFVIVTVGIVVSYFSPKSNSICQLDPKDDGRGIFGTGHNIFHAFLYILIISTGLCAIAVPVAIFLRCFEII